MNKYELALVLRPDLEEEAKVAESQKVQDLITRFEGTIEKIDDWGKRRLAYPIKKVNEGFFSFISFEADGSAPAEIESRIRIMENVLRYLIIRKDAK
ncbi:MAG TPA: 30S ribosomal protein S6 [Lachnospiraceae bacterium]|jgi:ribosomal protein S6|nr:30S ribosomal protein S6 [Lachnospiraceae bacterium]